jgi:two-component system, response regulator RegA
MSIRCYGAKQRPNLLLVDENKSYCAVMSAAFEERGFSAFACHSAGQAFGIIEDNPPDYVVTDLKLPDLSGLVLISRLKAMVPHTNIVVLTGHASIATAVEAIKLGATHYLAKPADADQIVTAFDRRIGDDSVAVNGKALSVHGLEWEYINWTLMQHGGNVSAAARALSMHRRTLQRKLLKRAAKN